MRTLNEKHYIGSKVVKMFNHQKKNTFDSFIHAYTNILSFVYHNQSITLSDESRCARANTFQTVTSHNNDISDDGAKNTPSPAGIALF